MITLVENNEVNGNHTVITLIINPTKPNKQTKQNQNQNQNQDQSQKPKQTKTKEKQKQYNNSCQRY